jgi:hypothetical protein
MQRLPYLQGLKSEVIIPQYSRNVYDHAVRMLGVKIVTVKDKAEFEAAFNERTAMVYILVGPDTGPIGTEVLSAIARQKRRARFRGCGGRGAHHPECAPATRRQRRRL